MNKIIMITVDLAEQTIRIYRRIGKAGYSWQRREYHVKDWFRFYSALMASRLITGSNPDGLSFITLYTVHQVRI